MLKELNECIITMFLRRQNISTKSKIIEKTVEQVPVKTPMVFFTELEQLF